MKLEHLPCTYEDRLPPSMEIIAHLPYRQPAMQYSSPAKHLTEHDWVHVSSYIAHAGRMQPCTTFRNCNQQSSSTNRARVIPLWPLPAPVWYRAENVIVAYLLRNRQRHAFVNSGDALPPLVATTHVMFVLPLRRMVSSVSVECLCYRLRDSISELPRVCDYM